MHDMRPDLRKVALLQRRLPLLIHTLMFHILLIHTSLVHTQLSWHCSSPLDHVAHLKPPRPTSLSQH